MTPPLRLTFHDFDVELLDAITGALRAQGMRREPGAGLDVEALYWGAVRRMRPGVAVAHDGLSFRLAMQIDALLRGPGGFPGDGR